MWGREKHIQSLDYLQQWEEQYLDLCPSFQDINVFSSGAVSIILWHHWGNKERMKVIYSVYCRKYTVKLELKPSPCWVLLLCPDQKLALSLHRCPMHVSANFPFCVTAFVSDVNLTLFHMSLAFLVAVIINYKSWRLIHPVVITVTVTAWEHDSVSETVTWFVLVLESLKHFPPQ